MKTSRLSFLFLIAFFTLISSHVSAEDGYRLWQRYERIEDSALLKNYRQLLQEINIPGSSPVITVIKDELKQAFTGILGSNIPFSDQAVKDGTLLIGTPENLPRNFSLNLKKQTENIGPEGYYIFSGKVNRKNVTIITANTETGLLYGTFHFLRLLQTHQPIRDLSISSSPKIKHRILNHWDNLDRTVERGYSGFSLWDWHKLPGFIDQRYIDYARANASIGINGTVLTNVNANALVLTEDYLLKTKALADAFRPYGLKVYLTARFSAPIEIGQLQTADPLDPKVPEWWKKKVEEIYSHIPDFGGFLVKADSEGQPGPHNYGRSQAEGANMLADALAPKGGIVMWRAFVYSDETPDDRAKQAYNEFKPLDGKFRDNVLVQVKNGAIDFQPREPFHPLFGAMPETPLMMEFQITQEYLGQGTQLVYLSPLFKEVLESDTYAKGLGSTVAKVVDGTLDQHQLTGIAGVSNIGTDRNWTGHHFGQANWYAFGRLAWDHQLTSGEIAKEWLKMTFTNRNDFVEPVTSLMLGSHEAAVNYMTPLGLHHIMGWSHHYGPAPWIKDKHRADWTSVYYHQADEYGIGFDRTKTGSNAVAQYLPPVQEKFGNIESCPEKYLLWFHHVSWDYSMESGRTLWNELCHRYYSGVESVEQMQTTWAGVREMTDPERFRHVESHLRIQKKEAEWWRNACLLYFQSFSKRPVPDKYPKPEKSLEYYMSLDPKFVPGI